MSSAARLRLFYFLYNCAVGCSFFFLAPYLRGLGFSGEAIGTVLMLSPAVGLVAPLVWATAADRLGDRARALSVAALWSLIVSAFYPFTYTPLAFGAVVFFQALGEKAIIPLSDAVTLDFTHAHPETSYARIRLFGSLGFMVSAQAMGVALAARGGRPGDLALPIVMTLSVAAYALAARHLPTPSLPSAHPLAHPFAHDALELVRDRRVLLLIGTCALHWIACAPYNLLFGVFVEDRALPASITGLGSSAGVIAEILALLLFPRLEARLPRRVIFALAFSGSAARWFFLSRAHSATAVVLLQLFHGCTFGLFWGASIRALSDFVPPALRATGQALYTTLVYGLGNMVGFQLAGRAYDRAGSVAPVFSAAAAIEAVLALLVLIRPWRPRRRRGP